MSKPNLSALFDAAFNASIPAFADELRSQYQAAGVNRRDAQSVTVEGDSGDLSVHGNQTVWDNEHGTESGTPSAITRKYGANSPQGSAALLSNLASKLGEL